MNEDNFKIILGNKKKTKEKTGHPAISFFVKPAGKFWKRYFNKRVRKGKTYKRDNWFEWS